MKTYKVAGVRWVCENFALTVEANSHAEAIRHGKEAARVINPNSIPTVDWWGAEVETTKTPKISSILAQRS